MQFTLPHVVEFFPPLEDRLCKLSTERFGIHVSLCKWGDMSFEFFSIVGGRIILVGSGWLFFSLSLHESIYVKYLIAMLLLRSIV